MIFENTPPYAEAFISQRHLWINKEHQTIDLASADFAYLVNIHKYTLQSYIFAPALKYTYMPWLLLKHLDVTFYLYLSLFNATAPQKPLWVLAHGPGSSVNYVHRQLFPNLILFYERAVGLPKNPMLYEGVRLKRDFELLEPYQDVFKLLNPHIIHNNDIPLGNLSKPHPFQVTTNSLFTMDLLRERYKGDLL